MMNASGSTGGPPAFTPVARIYFLTSLLGRFLNLAITEWMFPSLASVLRMTLQDVQFPCDCIEIESTEGKRCV